jgi:hypothetical protein
VTNKRADISSNTIYPFPAILPMIRHVVVLHLRASSVSRPATEVSFTSGSGEPRFIFHLLEIKETTPNE